MKRLLALLLLAVAPAFAQEYTPPPPPPIYDPTVEQTYIEGIKQKMSDVKELEEKNRLYTYYLDAVKRDGIPYELVTKALPKIEAEINSGFGTEFPKHAHRGDTFVRVDRLPSVVYKYNGKDWMEVDKNLTDSYTYDIAYIDHLIERITSGEYDAELLSETEREQVAQRLQSNTNTNT